MNGTTVLILDAQQRSALAATRSLGGRGVSVITADEANPTLAGASRHSRRAIVYPSPYATPERFIDWFEEFARSGAFRVAMPMSEVTTDLLARHRDRWPGVALPLANIETIDRLANKIALMRHAGVLGLPTPHTMVVMPGQDAVGCSMEIGFPVVIKPYRSRIRLGDGWLTTRVRYARTSQELAMLQHEEVSLKEHPFMLQEFIRGSGQGIFAIYDQGNPLAFFSHRRIREKPPSGGVSVLSESIPLSPELRDNARRLLDSVCWHGVAMVEYKVTDDGTPFLMEVNTRFWGSLQLSIDCGVDFPAMLYELACGRNPAPIGSYIVGRRLRWWLGDLDRLYLALKSPPGSRTESPLQSLRDFLTPDFRTTRHEVFRWGDMNPARFEGTTYMKNLLHR